MDKARLRQVIEDLDALIYQAAEAKDAPNSAADLLDLGRVEAAREVLEAVFQKQSEVSTVVSEPLVLPSRLLATEDADVPSPSFPEPRPPVAAPAPPPPAAPPRPTPPAPAPAAGRKVVGEIHSAVSDKNSHSSVIDILTTILIVVAILVIAALAINWHSHIYN